jgi:ketosteroid isomerase-like protein
MRASIALCLLGAWLSLAAAAAGQSKDENARADAEIRQRTREFVQGFNTGDVDRIMPFYADTYVDVNMRNPIQTRAERREYYRKIIERRDTTVDVTPEEIIVSPPYAYVRGTIRLEKKTADGAKTRRELRYMEVIRSFPDGWKAIWGMDAEIYPEGR